MQLDKLYADLYDTPIRYRDITFLKNLETFDHQYVDKPKICLEKANFNPNYGKFLQQLKEHQIDAFIYGSYALHCVYNKNEICPNDVDLCIRNITKTKLLKVESIIREVYPNQGLVVVRHVFMMSFCLYDLETQAPLQVIQVNLLKISSWSELLITSISDITCLGFEILSQSFLYLKSRWGNIFRDKHIIFTNHLTIDDYSTLKYAYLKYYERGFKVKLDYRSDICELRHSLYHFDDQQSNYSYMERKTSIVPTLYRKYAGKRYNCISNTVDDIFFGSEIIPRIQYLSVSKVKHASKAELKIFEEFLNFPQTIKFHSGFKIGNYFKVGLKCCLCQALYEFHHWPRCHEDTKIKLVVY